MSIYDILTKEQIEELNSLDDPNLTYIIRLSEKWGVNVKEILNYLIDKELDKLNM